DPAHERDILIIHPMPRTLLHSELHSGTQTCKRGFRILDPGEGNVGIYFVATEIGRQAVQPLVVAEGLFGIAVDRWSVRRLFGPDKCT
ncbi:MAG: hypothetical protein AAF501_03840, partial [Pseudomonadota bacterium]